MRLRQCTSVDEAQQGWCITELVRRVMPDYFSTEEEESMSDVVVSDFMKNGFRDSSCHPVPCV